MTKKKVADFHLPNDGTRPDKLHELNVLAFNNFEDAELIYGLDEETGNRFLAFGGETLKEIAESNDESRECSVIVISILQRTEEHEALVAAVEVARSYSDYAGGDHCVADILEQRRREFNRLVQGEED
jgi:hypothetical protein